MEKQTEEQKKEKKRAAQAAWRAKNKDHIKAYNAAWVAKNSPTYKPRKSGYHRERYLKNKVSVIAAVTAWQAANPERAKANNSAWKAANPEKHIASANKWAAENPEARRVHRQNRRARKKEAGGMLSVGLSAKLFKLQKGKCPCCKQPLGDDYHMDHKMPLALGGTNTDDNMQLLRQRCNNQKSAKHPVDFMQSRGFLL